MRTDTYTLTATPQLVYTTTNAAHRIYLYTDDNAVYVGASDVTSSNGLDIHKDVVTEIFMDEHETLYAATTVPGEILIILHPSNA